MGVNYPKKSYDYTRKLPNILKKIYMSRVNKIKFTYICIFMWNSIIRVNHPSVHVIIFRQNNVNFAYKTEQKKFFHTEFEKYKLLNLVETLYGGKLRQKMLWLHKKSTRYVKLKLEILEKICMPRDNEITFTYISIFMRNSFIRGNHPLVHVILFIKNKVNFTYNTKLQKFIHAVDLKI